jgi:hypothetical protein
MTHLLVVQLRFARSELKRCLQGVSEEDAQRRVGLMNCISWMVGHLANQESLYWMLYARGIALIPELNELVGTGKPASRPSLELMWAAWDVITQAADPYLDSLTPQELQQHFTIDGKGDTLNIGTRLLRNIYHYWFHIGEAYAVRQVLGHTSLPDFVGNMSNILYYPEE